MSAQPSFDKKMNLKKKIIAQGIFQSELNAVLTARLASEGYAGVKIKNSANKREIVLYATRTQNVLGDNGRLFNEVSSLLRQRFSLSPDAFNLYVDRVPNRALCAESQAEALKYKLAEGVQARRAALSVMNFIMKNEADGVEVSISGKLRGTRGKTVKFKSGYMVKSGDAKERFVETAIRHVHMRQGVLGVRLSVQMPRGGERGQLPDVVRVLEPVELQAEGDLSAVNVEQPAGVILPRRAAPVRLVDEEPLVPRA